MGHGDLGVFNDGSASTPNLDRLAAEGLNFRQHYSASPICAPARASLLTGRYPHRTGAITQHEMHGLDRIALREVTVADAFRQAGYATGLVGKWHNGALDRRFEPNARGFEEFVGFCGGWVDYYRYYLQRDSAYHPSDGRYLTDVLTAEAKAFINRHKNEPFFLTLAYNAPHSPFQAPQDVVDRYLARGFNRIVATTYAMIEIMDDGIGQVLEKLADEGLAENTIVVFTSDNGPAFFNPPYMLEPGEPTFNERFNEGMRGSKGWVYEGGIRVPLLLRWTGKVDGGRVSDDLVHFTDWMPTLLGLSGLPPPAGPPMDGHDLSPLILGEALTIEPRRYWQWNFYLPDISTNAAVRDGDWKLVRPMIRGSRFFNKDLYASPEDEALQKAFVEADLKHKENPAQIERLVAVPRLRPLAPEPVELYDLSQDPGESVNLAAAHPDRARRMLGDLETWFEAVERDRRSIAPRDVSGPAPCHTGPQRRE